jgi:transcription elongation factor GreA-like protein
MNSEAVSALLVKNPSLKASKSKLEAMKSGAYVIHRSWGFGQIKSFDDTTLRLVIDFKGKKAHAMDPAFCVGTMEVLPENHLLVRKETEPKKIAELIADNPAQLIVEALESYPNKATTAIDLEITLAQVVGEEKFKKWWGDARKAVAKDPRVSGAGKEDRVLRAARDAGFRRGRDLRPVQFSTRSARRRISLAEELATPRRTRRSRPT